MRAWTIVLFILAIHAGLAMFNYTNVMDIGLGVTLDPVTGTLVPGSNAVELPSTTVFNTSGHSKEEVANNSVALKTDSFIGLMIESILGVGEQFSKLITTFKDLLFSIHYLTAPFFGDVNAWILEGVVDFIFVIALFQMVTGRSFKTME
jgi:hypothetical protein